jgi:hypothetical protein
VRKRRRQIDGPITADAATHNSVTILHDDGSIVPSFRQIPKANAGLAVGEKTPVQRAGVFTPGARGRVRAIGARPKEQLDCLVGRPSR